VTLTNPGDYTLSGVGNPSGFTVTLTAAAQAGDLIVVVSAQPVARSFEWTDGQALRAQALNAEFARWWIALQQVRRDVARTVRLPLTDPSAQLELPAADVRAGKFLGFDGAGAAVAMGAPDAPLGAVARSGDTMTGNLTISKSSPVLQLNSPTVTTRGLQFCTNGVARWEIFAWNDAESGGNAGSTLYLSRYDDGGAGLSHIFSADRATGRLTFLGSVLPRVPGVDPTDPNDVVRKAYADRMAAPPGAVMAFARSSVPTGWLKCNGAAVSRTTYADLFAAIGTTYGAGDGSTTFNLPDLRGEFIRGHDDGRGVDAGRGFGTAQLDAFQGHFHQPKSPMTSFWGNNGNTGSGQPVGSTYAYGTTTGGPVSDGTNGTPRTAEETRPRNVALMYCIKF
jgi:hypothetical protein